MIKRFIVSLTLLSIPLFAMPTPAAATSGLTTFAACGNGVANFLGLQPWYACLQKKYSTSGSTIKIGELNDIWLIVLVIIDDALKVAAYIAAGFIIWGGIQYAKSSGDSSKTAAAKDTIINAVIGLVITFLAVAIVQFIAGRF